MDLPAHMGGQDLYSGQPLDHEPNMGQVPMMPPGTPPGEGGPPGGWGPAFPPTMPPQPGQPYPMSSPQGGGGGRRSPNLPLGQPQMIPTDAMQGMLGPVGTGSHHHHINNAHARGLQPDVSDGGDPHGAYDYTPTASHVEVY